MEDDVSKIGNLGPKFCIIKYKFLLLFIIASISKVEFTYLMLRSVGSTLRFLL